MSEEPLMTVAMSMRAHHEREARLIASAAKAVAWAMAGAVLIGIVVGCAGAPATGEVIAVGGASLCGSILILLGSAWKGVQDELGG
jgi:hypothetical protein